MLIAWKGGSHCLYMRYMRYMGGDKCGGNCWAKARGYGWGFWGTTSERIVVGINC